MNLSWSFIPGFEPSPLTSVFFEPPPSLTNQEAGNFRMIFWVRRIPFSTDCLQLSELLTVRTTLASGKTRIRSWNMKSSLVLLNLDNQSVLFSSTYSQTGNGKEERGVSTLLSHILRGSPTPSENRLTAITYRCRWLSNLHGKQVMFFIMCSLSDKGSEPFNFKGDA